LSAEERKLKKLKQKGDEEKINKQINHIDWIKRFYLKDYEDDERIIVCNKSLKFYKFAETASIIGDTVGDPMKDTSGPSLNILIKLSSIISVVFGTLFLNTSYLIK
jgi:hypothetical protein